MSYNKNTMDFSSISNTVNVLKRTKIPFKLYKRGVVDGYGLNDGILGENDGHYTLYRLEYADMILVDYMERTHDCDCDDTIVTREYVKGETIPKHLEVTLADSGFEGGERDTCKGEEKLEEVSFQFEVLPGERLTGNLV